MMYVLSQTYKVLIILAFSLLSACVSDTTNESIRQEDIVSKPLIKCPNISGTYRMMASEYFHEITSMTDPDSVDSIDACVRLELPYGGYTQLREWRCSLNSILLKELSKSERKKLTDKLMSSENESWDYMKVNIRQPNDDFIIVNIYDNDKFLYTYIIQAKPWNYSCNSDEVVLYNGNFLIANNKETLYIADDGSLIYKELEQVIAQPVTPFFPLVIPMYHYEERRLKWERVD